ncbi:hypothetical protein AAL_02004 [Moelleriella libera RCEF 2490]|uniref:Vegetative cell wall protein gp1 n=1 Tax=Moelleriella libera RCEF 2490 TaxID=1081109 RepID=A0A162IWI9_9HYPO|nr:hypothetical protein AAL_02004 [Moelleriella libera RCEF 2490]
MGYPSPRTPGSSPVHEWDYGRMFSSTPTPSSRQWFESSTPRRPATRAAHARSSSYTQHGFSTPRTHMESPRYNSQGDYCTVDVSGKAFPSSRRTSARYQTPPRRDRRHSYTYVRGSTPYGESDEDEIIETYERTYVLPAQSRYDKHHRTHASPVYEGGWYTNQSTYPQSSPYYAEPTYTRVPPYSSPQPSRSSPQSRPPTSHGHHRRSSASVPQRPSTVKPNSSSQRCKSSPLATAKATEADARKHRIPPGYQLKNWDPSEEPILLLGSVFDANSLGKWIYDWTVYAEGAGTPIAEMSGDLWLLLIQLAGKVKRAEEVIVQLRADERELLDDFIAAGDRLTDKLRDLLKACEVPMLRARKKGSSLGKNSGVEFVNTLFGREKELGKTEAFMQSVRLFNMRFDANCEPIMRRLGV